MTITLGIDPGLSGAIAAVDHAGALIGAWDMPVAGGEVSPAMMHYLFDGVADWREIASAAIESVHSMPGQGVSSTFKFGQATGTVLGFLGAGGIPVVKVTPQTWKKHHRLIGKDKEAGRLLALETWPEQADLFRLKKHHGRADAALIALWAVGRAG